jgi:hypothetical protein
LLPVPQSFFAGAPPTEGKPLGGASLFTGSRVVRLIHRHRSVGWADPIL